VDCSDSGLAKFVSDLDYIPKFIIVLSDRCESQVPRKLFAAVYKDKVELYDLKSQQSTTSLLPWTWQLYLPELSTHRNTLLGVGAYLPSTAVYELELLTSLPHLHTPRACSGLARTADFLYVFGGWDDSAKYLKSCEKYSLQARKWLPMEDMQI